MSVGGVSCALEEVEEWAGRVPGGQAALGQGWVLEARLIRVMREEPSLQRPQQEHSKHRK